MAQARGSLRGVYKLVWIVLVSESDRKANPSKPVPAPRTSQRVDSQTAFFPCPSLEKDKTIRYRPQPLRVEIILPLIAPVDTALRIGQAQAYDLSAAGGGERRQFV